MKFSLLRCRALKDEHFEEQLEKADWIGVKGEENAVFENDLHDKMEYKEDKETTGPCTVQSKEPDDHCNGSIQDETVFTYL